MLQTFRSADLVSAAAILADAVLSGVHGPADDRGRRYPRRICSQSRRRCCSRRRIDPRALRCICRLCRHATEHFARRRIASSLARTRSGRLPAIVLLVAGLISPNLLGYALRHSVRQWLSPLLGELQYDRPASLRQTDEWAHDSKRGAISHIRACWHQFFSGAL